MSSSLKEASRSKSAVRARPLFSSDMISYFTEEYCDQLALALNEATGWRLFACAEKWIQDESYKHDDRCYGEGVVHIVVGLPDGKFLDINGIQTKQQISREWPGTFLRETQGCCFNTWVHPRKVSQIKVQKATDTLIKLVADYFGNECLRS